MFEFMDSRYTADPQTVYRVFVLLHVLAEAVNAVTDWPVYQAMPADEPVRRLIGMVVGPFHWENRRLRIPELRRLFTFPDYFELVGRRTSVQAQMGNAVPPLLAQRVAEQVALAIA